MVQRTLVVNAVGLTPALIGENTPEILAADLKLEYISQNTCKESIAYCESVRDFVSREIFQRILDDTEEHIDWLETQIELVDKLTLPNYRRSLKRVTSQPIAPLMTHCVGSHVT